MSSPLRTTRLRTSRPGTSRPVAGKRFGRVLTLSLVVGLLGGLAPARADDGAFDQVLNSNDAKNDRTGAPSGGSLVALKTGAATDVAKRQRVLDRLSTELGNSPIDCGANAELTTKIADSSVVMNEIAGRIAAATDMKTAKAAASELFPATRVFSLVLPQVQVSLFCASAVVQTQQLQARITGGNTSLEALKGTAEVQAALVAGATAAGTLKIVPSLGQTATTLAPLSPDKGDAAIAAANLAALNASRVQVRAVESALDTADRQVREFERLADLAKRKVARTTKVKKPVK